MTEGVLHQRVSSLVYRHTSHFLKRAQVAAARPPRRGEGSRGSANENAKANVVGVGCVRCARAHLPFGLRGAPAQSFVVAVGSERTIPNRAIPRSCQTLRVEEKFHSRGQISPHMAGISSLGRRGCLQDGRGEAGAPERDSADDFCPRRLCSAPRGALQRRSCRILLSSSLRRAVGGPRR